MPSLISNDPHSLSKPTDGLRAARLQFMCSEDDPRLILETALQNGCCANFCAITVAPG